MLQTHNKLETILLLDGIAIFFIVFFHELLGLASNPLNSLCPYLVVLGMTLFTFSSGYKLIINHSNKIDQKVFLSTYYIKRFVRLYKPYLGYTLLMVFPVLLVVYIASHFFHLAPPSLTRPFWILLTSEVSWINIFITIINNINIFDVLNFLCGDNLIVGQLWYLIVLVAITSICFTILYFLNIKWLFLAFFPFFLISLLILFEIIQLPSSFFGRVFIGGVFRYLPFYIFGCYWANNQQQYQTTTWLTITRFSFPFFFLIWIVSPTFSQKPILIEFCCFLFPIFLLSIFDYVKTSKLLYPSLMFCGIYSFQIYLFHEPLIQPILSRCILDILKIDYIFMPLIISFLAIYCCVITYKIVKRVHLNILFE